MRLMRYGTGKIGSVFGWVMLLWFFAIGAVAIPYNVHSPQIFAALDPIHAIGFLTGHGLHGFLLLGSIVLCVTGCEALYAKSSRNLAAAYGIAVTGTMAITSFLIFLVCQRNWGWSLRKALLLYIPFAIIDTTFFSANVVKVAAGGWFPLVVGVCMFTVMTTWWRGRFELSKVMESGMIPDDMFLADIAETPLPRVQGTAVFMASGTDGIPNVLLHHVKHNKVLHEQVVLLSIVSENVPFAVGNSAIVVRDLGQGFFRVVSRSGFVQQPDVPRILARCGKRGLVVNDADTTYYLRRQTLLTTGKSRIARWRKMLFSFLSHNSRSPTTFFKLPPNRVVELGLQIEYNLYTVFMRLRDPT